MNPIASVTLLCLVSFAVSAQGLKCYTCAGGGCGDPFRGTEDQKTDCTPDLAQKAVAGFKNAANSISSTLGQLGINTGSVETPNFKMACAKVTLIEGHKREEVIYRSCVATTNGHSPCDIFQCSICYTDLCNAATSTQISFVLMIVSGATLMAYFHGDKEVTTRSCASKTDKLDFCDAVKNDNVKCNTCEDELCNGATATHISFGLLIVSGAMVMRYFH